MEARKRALDRDVALAWHVERFARERRLKPLREYLRETAPDESRGGAALLGVLRSLKKKGVPMTIKRVKRIT